MKTTLVQCDVNQFHPSLREAFAKEIDRINREQPPFLGNISIVIADKIPMKENCDCGKDHPEKEIEEGTFAVTRTNVVTDEQIIFLKARMFGVNGDIETLNAALKNDESYGFHGGMIDPTYIFSHEYGHCIDHMLQQTFGKDDDGDTDTPQIAKAYESMYELAADSMSSFDMIMNMVGIPHVYDPKEDKLVSGYAYTSPQEFFAETYAALYWGNEHQKTLPTAVAMRDLITKAYVEVFKQEVRH